MTDLTSLVPLFQKLQPMTDLDYEAFAGAAPGSYIAQHGGHLLIVEPNQIVLHFLDENGEIDDWELIVWNENYNPNSYKR